MNRFRILTISVLISVLSFVLACNTGPKTKDSPAEKKSTSGLERQIPGKLPQKNQPDTPTKNPFRVDNSAKLRTALVDYYTWYSQQARIFINRHRLAVAAHILKSPRFRNALKVIYSKGNYGFQFFDAEGLSERGTSMQAFVNDMKSHGMENNLFFTKSLESALVQHKTLLTAYKTLKGKKFGDAKLQALWTTVSSNRQKPADAALIKAFKESKLSDSDVALLTQVRARTKALFEAREKLNKIQIGLDVKLMRNFFLYSLSFRNVWLYDILKENKLNRKYRRLADAILTSSWKEVTDAKTFAEGLKLLWPRDEQYERLRKALAVYRTLAEANADKLKKLKIARRTSYRKGANNNFVLKLKARLALEGYYTAAKPWTKRFDQELEDAVKKYQRTHQQTVDGRAGIYLVRSLNISLWRRVRVLKLNLYRWRKSKTNRIASTYLRVNLPSQTVHLYKDGKNIKTHRVIIGSNKKDTDASGKTDYINRTQIFSRPLTTIVLNPVWRVPPRIKSLELDKELEKEPDYYEKNNFTVITRKDGTEMVWQNPGPKNALGRVKFLFPNPFMIYMHDTPKRKLFRFAHRAFSHGCIRVHKPLELARQLFKIDNSLSDEKFDKILKSLKESAIKLKTKIPVHIEYYSASVNDAGELHFHNDVYYFDRDHFRNERKKRLEKKNVHARN